MYHTIQEWGFKSDSYFSFHLFYNLSLFTLLSQSPFLQKKPQRELNQSADACKDTKKESTLNKVFIEGEVGKLQYCMKTFQSETALDGLNLKNFLVLKTIIRTLKWGNFGNQQGTVVAKYLVNQLNSLNTCECF
eukprot:TRINITY_DN6381_c0_g2_i4.p1 TRINITY_DN6381_c0_g2~~TRINITY_DN6381_c0_g2_i4.p1  ORF type:complete len:134 (+),score=1.96 TRINITY_DN6381_c0_g2_i4:160-561(+)